MFLILFGTKDTAVNKTGKKPCSPVARIIREEA